jgi:hypothetical protein
VILLDSSGNNQVLAEKIDKDEKEKYRKEYLKDYKQRAEVKQRIGEYNLRPEVQKHRNEIQRCYRRNKRLENQKGLKERTRNNN